MDILSTVEALGIEGLLRGDEFVAPCPRHEARTGSPDANPSWSIHVDTGLFFCFSCGYRGGIVSLIADVKGIGHEEAKDLVVKPDIATTISKIPGAYILAHAASPVAESRLSRYSEPPRWARAKRMLTRAAVAAFGVRWDYASDAWILPIREPSDSSLIGWQEKSETDRRFCNFPTGVRKSRCLFGYDVFPGGRMVVVESPLDAVRLHSEGHYGAVATFGATVSKAQILLMTTADDVVFALDNPRIDSAGRKASTQLLSDTKGILRSVRFFDYGSTDAKDPGDMTADEIRSGIDRARSRAHGARAIA